MITQPKSSILAIAIAIFLTGKYPIPKLMSAVVLILVCLATPASADVVFNWAEVGNPGNAADTPATGSPSFGSVGNTYRISKHEVTNAQYAHFLNQVATTDSFGGVDTNLFNSNMNITRSGSSGNFTYAVNAGFDNNPVNFVSFVDAMRFTNWLENGQGTGGTESGVYSVSNGTTETRAAGATYFIPTEDEWYKAAYHDPNAAGSYWDFPTQSNTVPTAEAPPGGANSANAANAVGNTTDVGAYTGSTSFYGTFDQAGNVWEWNENLVASSTARRIRGGSFSVSAFSSSALVRNLNTPAFEGDFIGFRVASRSVPEPSSLCLILGLLGVGSLRRNRRRAVAGLATVQTRG